MATWDDLPTDLLISIYDRLDFLSRVNFSAVCTTWSSTLVPRLPSFPRFCHDQPIPWLFLDGGITKYTSNITNYFIFFYLSTAKSYLITNPILLFSINCPCWLGSNFGSLVFMDPIKLKLHLISPLAGNQVLLPSIKLPHGYQGNLIDGWDTHQKSLKLSSHEKVIPCRVPDHSSDRNTGLFLLCFLWPQGLTVLKVGENKWTWLDLKMHYQDAIVYQGKIYALADYSLHCWELKCSSFKAGKVFKIRNIMLHNIRKYLVEYGGKLLMVCKVRGNCGNAMTVYELDLDQGDRLLSPVKSIGENAVFIGLSYSRMVSTVGLNRVRGDSIYYLGNNYNDDSGVYNLQKRTFEQFSGAYFHSRFWFWPCDLK